MLGPTHIILPYCLMPFKKMKRFFGAEGAQKMKIRVPNKRFPGICMGPKSKVLLLAKQHFFNEKIPKSAEIPPPLNPHMTSVAHSNDYRSGC